MMSEKKGVRQLERELKAARNEERREHENRITKNRDFSLGGIDPNTKSKPLPNSTDIPDAILLPKKKKLKKENIPW